MDFGVNGYEVELGYGANDRLFFASERVTSRVTGRVTLNRSAGEAQSLALLPVPP